MPVIPCRASAADCCTSLHRFPLSCSARSALLELHNVKAFALSCMLVHQRGLVFTLTVSVLSTLTGSSSSVVDDISGASVYKHTETDYFLVCCIYILAILIISTQFLHRAKILLFMATPRSEFLKPPDEGQQLKHFAINTATKEHTCY